MANIDRQTLERASRDVIGYLLHTLGRQVGLLVFVFEFGTAKNIAYISNGSRAEMIQAAKEWIARLEAGLETDPPGPRATS